MINIKIFKEDRYKIVLLLFIIFISRLPQVLSPYLLIDGDEGIVGVMSMDFIKGNGYPYFFASQSYGLTIVEIIFISFFFIFFGVTSISLKIAILSLWSFGIIFFYKALRNFSSVNNWFAFIVVLIFILFPSWQVWSMKARGGYVTAFTCFSLVFYLLSNLNKKTLVKSFIIGFLSFVIYQAQPLWLVGLLPILIFFFIKDHQIKKDLIFILGVVSAIILFFYIKLEVSHFTKPPIFNSNSLSNIKQIPELVYRSLLGGYYYAEDFNFFSYSGVILVFVYLITISVIVTCLIFSTKKINFSVILVVSFLSTIGYLLVIKPESPRYLLPLSQIGFMVIYIYMVDNVHSIRLTYLKVLPLIILGVVNVYSFKNYQFESRTEKNMKRLISSLKTHGKTHIFFKHSLLEWQVMFYAKREISGRSFSKFDRFQNIVREVDSMLCYDSDKVAIVDYYNPNTMIIHSETNNIIVDNTFIIRKEVSREQLIKEGFTFKDWSF